MMAKRLMNTHWTMRMWKDGDIWGVSYMCREIPHLNSFHTFKVGKETRLTHFFLGHDAPVSYTT